MANFGEINFKLLVVSTNQSEIEEELNLLDEKQNQIKRVLIKQYVLDEKKVARKIIQFLVGKIVKISEELKALNQKARADLEDLVKMIHDTTNENNLKHRYDVLQQDSTTPLKKRKIDPMRFQSRQTPASFVQSQFHEIPTKKQMGSNQTSDDFVLTQERNFKYTLNSQLKESNETFQFREIPLLKKIKCKIK